MGIWAENIKLHYSVEDVSLQLRTKSMLNPSIIAASVFRRSASTNGLQHIFWRWVGLILFSSDVSAGAQFAGALRVPHPLGITIGSGAVIGRDLTIFQNVTIGSSRTGKYPKIGSGVTIYPGAVIAGPVRVGDGAVIGANVFVRKDIPVGGTTSAETGS
ncbi:hypothetical protein GS506_18600 [Rhodococcus hoagii]|nr:hypothetical protein [Prescottella equi]